VQTPNTLAPTPRTLRWWLHPNRLTAALFSIVIIAGTIGYGLIEGWSAWDAFYMTVITVTTVGYREIHPMTRAGEVFTTVLLISGVGTVFYAVTLMVARVVESNLTHRWDERRRTRMIDSLHDHFIVCGYGRIGQVIVEELTHQGIPFVVVERDPAVVHEVLQTGTLAVSADSSNENVLRRLHIERARGLIAAVGTDAENVYTVLTARLLRPDLYIVSRAESDDAVSKLKQAGANRVISPYRIGGQHIAQTALRPAVVDFVQLATSSASLDLAMEQLAVDRESRLAGRTLAEAGIRQRFGVIVVAVQRAGTTDFNPSPDRRLEPGDHLLVMGPPERVKAFSSEARPVAEGDLR